jgi:hypothetical protein
MATYTQKGLITVKDTNGDTHQVYPITKDECVTLSDSVLASYGLAAGSKADEVLGKLATALPWVLIDTFDGAGAFTWTVPDIYGNGLPYEIGAFLIGGGGSGAAAGYDTTPGFRAVSGGASGYTTQVKMTVTPNDVLNGVVGAGGTSVTSTFNASVSGNAGGTTSFNGATALGGGGGKTGGNKLAAGADGGQGSDAVSSDGGLNAIAPKEGGTTNGAVSTNAAGVYGGRTNSLMAFNPFDMKWYLGAGGGARAALSQTTGTIQAGGKAGAAAASTSSSTVTAESATGYGNGGGGACVELAGTSPTVNSGAGSAGAVLIYARREAS